MTGYFTQERFEQLEARIKILEDLVGVTEEVEARRRGAWVRHQHGQAEPHAHRSIHLVSERADPAYKECPITDMLPP